MVEVVGGRVPVERERVVERLPGGVCQAVVDRETVVKDVTLAVEELIQEEGVEEVMEEEEEVEEEEEEVEEEEEEGTQVEKDRRGRG